MNILCLKNVCIKLAITWLAMVLSNNLCHAKIEKPLTLKSNLAKKSTLQDAPEQVRSWEEVCNQTKDAVFQIYSYISMPNFQEPFKSPERQLAVGSGFCVSPDGFILTNFHVIDLASVIIMYNPMFGREQLELSYVSGCPERDVALLKLTPASLEKLKQLLNSDEIPYLKCGNSDKLCEAQEIMTLGFPRGQEPIKSSLGIVSGREDTSIGECIQTTAPVNPGNSGGAFIDKAGNVVGICALKGRNTEGIGYLIPINNVLLMMNAFLEQPIVRCPYWGLKPHPTTEHMLKYLQCPHKGGIYISNVKAESIGKLLGIQKGDILHQIDGIQIDRYGYLESPWTKRKITLIAYLNRLAFGETVSCTIFRNGEDITFKHVMTPRQRNAIDYIYPWIEAMPEYEIIGGLVVGQLTLNYLHLMKEVSQSRDRLGLNLLSMMKYMKKDNQLEPRVCITSILPDSQAHKAESISSTDLILSTVNGIPVKTLADFKEAVMASAGKEYLVIQTEGGSLVTLSIKNIIEQEPILADRHRYKISNLITILEQKALF